jgi:mannonate dehydratase
MKPLRITDVKTILTQPKGIPLVVTKILTSDPEIYGLGCGTFAWRFRAVEACLEKHVKPFLIGKDPANIEDLWQSGAVNGYWRNGPVVNNAIGAVDMALWDIKGKMLGVPCYQLWGGMSRPAAAVYVHANGEDKEEVTDRASAFIERGFKYIRCQLGGYRGVSLQGARGAEKIFPGDYCDPQEKLRLIPEMFAHLRDVLPQETELLYDVHERLPAINAIWLAKALEPFRLYFLEDLFAPEDIGWFEQLRTQCATPLAMGELFTHPGESLPLVSQRLIDFIRVHPSTVGGITPCLKLAHLCESFGIRTAFHGPCDVSPVGMAANVHMDVHLHNFGIQEWDFRGEVEEAMFPGIPKLRDGYAWPNENPGLGIDIDEALAAQYPCDEKVTEWTISRLPDGTITRP